MGLLCFIGQATLKLTLHLAGHRLYYAARACGVMERELSDALSRPVVDKAGALHWVLQRVPQMLPFFGDIAEAIPVHRPFLARLASVMDLLRPWRPQLTELDTCSDLCLA